MLLEASRRLVGLAREASFSYVAPSTITQLN